MEGDNTSGKVKHNGESDASAEQALHSHVSEDKTNNDTQDDLVNPANDEHQGKLLLIHFGLCLCTFLVGLDFNLIAAAIPVITAEFDSISDVGWYGAAFMLAMSSTQSLAGKTYVLFPKKIAYLLYLAVFEAGSLVCALAPSSQILILGRIIAGAGASGIFAGGFVILTALVPLHKRSIFTGTINSTFAIASIIGPVLGGAFTQNVTWRWCFYINLPIGGFAALIVIILIRLESSEGERLPMTQKLKGLDGVGFLQLVGAITMLLLALQWGGIRYAWNSPTIIGLFIGAILTTAVFISWQIYMQDDALIPPKLFKAHRNVWLIFTAAFFVNGPFQMVIYWLPIWFQAVLGVSPIQSGVYYLPTVISDVLAAIIGSIIVMKIAYWNPLLLLAQAMVCLGGGLLTTIYPEISQGHWIGYQIFGGIGYSLSNAMVHIALQSSLPNELAPLGSSNVLMIISISCSVFLGVGQLVFQASLVKYLSEFVSPEVVQRVLSAGATDISTVVDGADLPIILEQYGRSITDVFYITAISPVISFFLICGCRWVSTKHSSSKTANEPEA